MLDTVSGGIIGTVKICELVSSSRSRCSSRRMPPGAAEVELELRRLENGQLAMLTFSALDRLVAGCGQAQPWVLVPAEHLDEARRTSGADVLLLDVPLPGHLRREPS